MRSRYTFDDDGRTVRIIDRLEGRSVTNDVDLVVRDLCGLNIPVDQRTIIYRDSEGRWDRILTKDGRFAAFAPLTADKPSSASGDRPAARRS